MKTKNKPHYSVMALVAAALTVAIWSCNKDEDPSLQDLRNDKITYLQDSIRVADSLKRIGAAGVVNYGITVVSGSTSTLFKNGGEAGRTNESKSVVEGAIVTISQFGKTLKDTTDAAGMVVFNGFFRNAINVTIEKDGFTKMSYRSIVAPENQTDNDGIFFVGNIIPLFELTGLNTATISGKATIQTDLTNKTRESVPDGTTIKASIDAMDYRFGSRFLTDNLYYYYADFESESGYYDYYSGHIIDASYQTGILGTVTAGAYTITVPAAIDGLPLQLDYSEIAVDQKAFENNGVIPGDRTTTYRSIFAPNVSASTIPAASGVTVGFESFTTQATATAAISSNAGTLSWINITNGGNGYSAATPPPVEITGGGGTGATATAVVGANGRIAAINLTSAGTGYTSVPTVNIIAGGTTANANSTLDGNAQQVFSIQVNAQGTGYTSAPTVGFSGGGGTGATASAQVANGRVVAITVTAGGSNFTGTPTVTLTGGGGAGATATAQMGSPVAQVNVTSGGTNYATTPVVTFSAPDFFNGTRAQGQAIIDPATRTVLGVSVTNPGSGYSSAPTVTINGGSLATATAFLTGGSVIGATIAPGAGYTAAPNVIFTGGGGQGAAATAIMADGKVVGLNITNGGSGYTTAPTITFQSGASATAYATVASGSISAITITDGGHDFTGAPRVTITSTAGGGATATATVAGGAVTGITVNTGGSGYLDGNIPAAPENFSATKGGSIETKPGLSYINDIYYGTGVRQPN